MVWTLVITDQKNLWMETLMNIISKKEKFGRKKHIGVFRRESSDVSMMMARFPVTLYR
jgi:hypothetical protein